MKNNKGFTLIELLAVIVVLAIIMVVAVPTVMKYANTAKINAKKQSAVGYVQSINNYFKEKEIYAENVEISCGEGISCDISNLNGIIKVSGEEPDSGTFTYENKKITEVDLCYDDVRVTYKDGEATAGISDSCQATEVADVGDISGDGNYKLVGDINESITILSGEISLDLNGHTVKGTITINDGSEFVLKNSKENGNVGGSEDSGIRIVNKGTFIMEGGTISDNEATKGGGVLNSGTFTMNGGIISNNNAENGGGVANSGKFIMNGGTISDNEATKGGGVLNSGTFIMTGGTISSNDATNGGGVSNSGRFIMEGGTISNNTASNGGGGVLNSGTFTMNGGSIKNNKAINNGGGVFNFNSTNVAQFTMNRGTIEDNTAPNGKGVNNSDGNLFEMTSLDAIIKDGRIGDCSGDFCTTFD